MTTHFVDVVGDGFVSGVAGVFGNCRVFYDDVGTVLHIGPLYTSWNGIGAPPSPTVITNPATYLYLPAGWDTAWKNAKANAATQQVNVVGIGDSIMAGQGSTDIMTDSWWAKFRAILLANTTLGGDYYSFLYSAALGLSTATPPVVVAGSNGSDWTGYFGGFNQAIFGVGHTFSPFIACTPPYKVTGFDILYFPDFDAGTFTYNIDGGSNTTVTTTGNNASFDASIAKVSITGLALGTHTLNINQNTSASNACAICGVAAYAGTSGLCFANMGLPGMGLVTGTAANNALSDTGLFPIDKLSLYQGYQGKTSAPTALKGNGFPAQPDLAIIAFGVNDASQSVSKANFRDALDRLVWSVRYGKSDACSIIIVAMFTADGTAASGTAVTNTDYTSTQNTAYRDIKAAMLEVAQANTCAFVDVHGAFGRLPVTNGWITSTSNIHPTPAGHTKIANLISTIV